MNKNKILERALLILLVSIILLNSVSALGVTPARKIIDFQPKKLLSYDIKILNSEHKDQTIVVFPKGELAEYINLERNIIKLNKEDESVSLRINLKTPETLNPGTIKSNIVISRLLEEKDIGELINNGSFDGNIDSNIGASVVVNHQLWIEVPYPGKYVKAKLRMQKFDGKPEFVISLYSVGDQLIDEVSARVELLGATYEQLAELHTNKISLESGKESKISTIWQDVNVSPGVYRARAIVQYDGQTIVLEDNFYIGNLDIEIKDLTINNFRLGTVAKLGALIESNWNSPIEGVYGEFDILSNGEKVSNFLTAPISIGPYAEETITGYWDTEGFEIGKYDILVKIHYNDKISEKIYDAVVGINDIEINKGIAGRVIGNKKSEGDNQLSLIIILMFILIIINVSLFLYINKRSKK